MQKKTPVVYLGWVSGSRRVALIEWTRKIQYKDAVISWLPHRKLGPNSTTTYWGIYCDLWYGLQYAQFSNMFPVHSSEIYGVKIFFSKLFCQFIVSLFSNCHYRMTWSDLFFAVKLNQEYWRPVDLLRLMGMRWGWLRRECWMWKLLDATFSFWQLKQAKDNNSNKTILEDGFI